MNLQAEVSQLKRELREIKSQIARLPARQALPPSAESRGVGVLNGTLSRGSFSSPAQADVTEYRKNSAGIYVATSVVRTIEEIGLLAPSSVAADVPVYFASRGGGTLYDGHYCG